MSRIYLVIMTTLVAALLGQKTACAQNPVQFPQGPASWTIDVAASPTPAEDAQPNAVHATHLEIVQDAQKRRTTFTASNGATVERWFIPGTNYIVIGAPDGTAFGVQNLGETAISYYIPFLEPDFTWVKPGSLVEKEPISYQGKKCFHYKGTLKRPGFSATTGKPESSKFTAQVWIDAKTGLPVALDDGTWLATYTYQPPPYPPLTVSPGFQKTFDRLSR